MSKSKRVSSYSEVYFDMLAQVESGQPYTSPVLPLETAKAIQFDLYGFRGALAHENHPKERLWSSYKISVKREEDGVNAKLKIESRDSAIHESLRSTLTIPSTTHHVENIPTEEELENDKMGDIISNLFK